VARSSEELGRRAAASLEGVRGLRTTTWAAPMVGVAARRGPVRMSTLRSCAVRCMLSASVAEGMATLGIVVTFLDGDSVPDSKLCVVVLADSGVV
jgi:hypothetical protein